MEQEYVGYIKITKSNKFRPAIASLHDVGEPDGDRSVWEQATGEIYEELDEAVKELQVQCKKSNIEKVCIKPIRKGQILFESYLEF